MYVTLSLDFRSRFLGEGTRGPERQLYMREHQHADCERQRWSIEVIAGTTWTQEQRSESEERVSGSNHEDAAEHYDRWTVASAGRPQKQQRREDLESDLCTRWGQVRT